MTIMKRKANQLDEMQEQELLKIEHSACWIAVSLLGRETKKRQAELEKEPEE